MKKYVKPEMELLDAEISDIIMVSPGTDFPTVDGDGAGTEGTLTPGGLNSNIFG